MSWCISQIRKPIATKGNLRCIWDEGYGIQSSLLLATQIRAIELGWRRSGGYSRLISCFPQRCTDYRFAGL